MDRTPRRILPAIVFAQFAGTALWFAVNGVMADLQRQWALPDAALGWLTSAVHAGFILGTLVFAMATIADRFSPRIVFLVCALLGALANLAAIWLDRQLGMLLGLRVLTGFALAGIYPVGMKIAAGWYNKGLGAALGFLVGALVLGTAMPHGLRAIGAQWPWQQVMIVTSIVTAIGGVVMLLCVPDGPYLKRGAKVDFRALAVIFRDPRVRASAFGYFGHMWELYAFIVMAPLLIAAWVNTGVTPGVSAFACVAIGVGAIGCAVGGLVAKRIGSARVARAQLFTSGVCCVLAPWMLEASLIAFALWIVVWGITVAGDSPQFSTLTALNAPPEVAGSVLTLVNCIGFTISIVSIQWVTQLAAHGWPLGTVMATLAIGPALGVWAMRPLLRASAR